MEDKIITERKLASKWYLEFHLDEGWRLKKGTFSLIISEYTAMAIILNEKVSL